MKGSGSASGANLLVIVLEHRLHRSPECAPRFAVEFVEQNVEMVFDMAGDCAFIENGVIAERMATAELRADDAALHRYLSV
jgi:ABC-type branched-subunit amino acid transport system ATPase component